MKKIFVKVIQFHNGLIDKGTISRPIRDELTIGRSKSNVVLTPNYPFISGNHGKIFLKEGFFSTHLDYEDFSSNGTEILYFNGKKMEIENVHRKPVKIKPFDVILILDERRTVGCILVPYIGTFAFSPTLRKRMGQLENLLYPHS